MDASSQHLAGANLRLGPPPPVANTHRLAAPGYALFGAAAYPRAANFPAVGYAPVARGQPFGGDATANPLSAGGHSNSGRVHRFLPAGFVHTAHGHPFGGHADANSLGAGGYSDAGSVHPFRADGRPLDPTRFTAPAASYVAAHQQLGATDRDLGTGAGAAGHAIFGAPGYSVHHLGAAADHPLGPGAGAAGHAIFGAPGYSVHQLGAAADHPLGPGAGAADHAIFGAPGYSGGDTVHHLGAAADHPLGPGAGTSDHTVAADHFAPIGAAPGARSSGSADPFAHISEVVVEQVWMENSAEVFTTVLNKLRQPRRRLFVALDLEYVADASTDVFYRPICNADWYDHLRDYVNRGDVLQLGLALAFDQAHPGGAGGAPLPVIAVEINFHFDLLSRNYNAESVNFLREQGHRLDDHRDRGIMPEWVFAGFLRHLPFGDHSVTWITYHGDRDIAFLLRLLQAGGRGELPPDRTTFHHQVREKFPIFYDVRVLGQIVTEGFAGKLTKLAKDLGIEPVGSAHFAASDALLTLSCFSEIAQISGHKLAARLSLLSGAEELDMGIRCARHVNDETIMTFEVREDNFEEEAWRIRELIMSNFKIVGLKVLLPKWTRPHCAVATPQQEYDLMKRRLSGITDFEIVVGFMNPDGMIAYGRMWKFCFGFKSSGNVHPRRFAQLIASGGASHNIEVAWVTCGGSHEIGCLINSFMAPDGLPRDLQSYMFHRKACFPAVYDIRFLAQQFQDISLLPNGCNGELGLLPFLRCYRRISEHVEFHSTSSAAQRKLMVG